MNEFRIIPCQIVACTQPQAVPAVPDATLSYTVDCWIDGGKIRLTGVRPQITSRPDPLAADPLLVFPFQIGEWCVLLGSWSGGSFSGTIGRVPGEVEAYGPCGGA